jgi:excisionase family DNA binding protein
MRDVVTSQDDPLLLPMREAARRLSISERSLARLVARGEIPSIEIGRRRLFSPRDLAEFIEARKCQAVG